MAQSSAFGSTSNIQVEIGDCGVKGDPERDDCAQTFNGGGAKGGR
jgi:hypothetical protein